MKFKKLITGLFCLCIMLGCLVVTGCGETPAKMLSNLDDLYGFSMVSSLEYALAVNGSVGSAVASAETEQAIVNTIDNYIDILSGYIGGQSPITIVSSDSDNETYKNKLTATVTDFNENTKTFVLYFNEVVTDTLEDAEEDDDYEVNTTIEGIMVYDEVNYSFTGTKEVENDEVEIDFIINLGSNRTVEVCRETEQNEYEFEYKVRNGETLVQGCELELEKDSEAVEMELVLTNGTNEYRYKFAKKENNGSAYIEITYSQTDGSGTIIVTQSENSYSYQFRNGNQNGNSYTKTHKK